MSQLPAQAVQLLTTCEDADLERIADEVQVGVSEAQSAKLFWTRKLTGLCVLCGTSQGIYSKKAKKLSMCQGCLKKNRGQLYDRRDASAILADLPEKAVVLRSRCITCNRVMNQNAGYVLSRLIKYGELRPVKYCKQCRNTAKPLKPVSAPTQPAQPADPNTRVFHEDEAGSVLKTLEENEVLMAAQEALYKAKKKQEKRRRRRAKAKATKKAQKSEKTGK